MVLVVVEVEGCDLVLLERLGNYYRGREGRKEGCLALPALVWPAFMHKVLVLFPYMV